MFNLFKFPQLDINIESEISMWFNNFQYKIWTSNFIEEKCLKDWFAFEIREIENEDNSVQYDCYVHEWEYENMKDYGSKKNLKRKITLRKSVKNPLEAKKWKEEEIKKYLLNPKKIFSGRISKKDIFGRFLNKKYSYKYHR